MVYIVRGANQAGDPVDLFIEVCWRCGIPVVTNLISMDEHVERAHPAPPPTGRHWRPGERIEP